MAHSNEFEREQQRAVERMREMNRRATPPMNGTTMPPTPPFVSVNRPIPKPEAPPPPPPSHKPVEKPAENPPGFWNRLNDLPLLGRLQNDPDLSLLLGLVLLLTGEKNDRLLQLALLYILSG